MTGSLGGQLAQRQKKARLHISEQPMTLSNWHKHINWVNFVPIAIIPFYGLVAAWWTPLRLPTLIWAVVYYFWTGLGITAGYHRLWAHRAYSARLPLKIFLALAGGGAVQGSIRWWSRHHRAHHRYTDTIKDPYSVHKGLLYSHFGWMMFVQNPNHRGRTQITDLDHDPVVAWQHKHYLLVMLSFGVVFPMLVAGLGWGDWSGGLVWAGILRFFFVQQATFCVNSLAHWLGEQPFDDKNSPRDHMITAVITLGEGYHNFHHEFPSDYRNAIKWYQYDPTKWCIVLWKWLGLAHDLKTFPTNEIEKGRFQQLQKRLDAERAKLDWGVPLEKLPVMEWDDFLEQSQTQALTVIAGVVHNITTFIPEHPGGKALIASAVGKDATSHFNGGVYNHSNAAHNFLSTLRVGVIRGGGEVEIWRRRDGKTLEGQPRFGEEAFIRAGEQATRVL